MLKANTLSNDTRLAHGFMTRQGGVSEGRYASLNCGPGSQDSPEHVVENRRRVLDLLEIPYAQLLSCYQIHACDVLTVTEAWYSDRPKADAMVTTKPNLALGILTADCAPILFVDEVQGIIGAAHAGWRGALGGIAQATLKVMEKLGAKNVKVAIGPLISFSSYEVGPEFPQPFLDQAPNNENFFRPSHRMGHFYFDLGGYLETQLSNFCSVERLDQDTLSQEELFFSNRRTVLNGGGDYGRQISVIALRS